MAIPDLNHRVAPYLDHADDAVRLEVVKSWQIQAADELQAMFQMVGNSDEAVRQAAHDAIVEADYRNVTLLLEALSGPRRSTREGILARSIRAHIIVAVPLAIIEIQIVLLGADLLDLARVGQRTAGRILLFPDAGAHVLGVFLELLAVAGMGALLVHPGEIPVPGADQHTDDNHSHDIPPITT